jgi:FixJ family two-component response regulator
VQPSQQESIVHIVDDDLDVSEGLRSLLESVGLKSRVFRSASEFMIADRADGASCLILDVRLPGLSGLELQAELVHRQENLPIIFVTGHGDIPMCVQAMKAGAVAFLTKPFRDQDLLDAVQVALDRSRANREADLRMRDLRELYGALTAREKQVMDLVCAGLMNKQIGSKIGISEVTVKMHRHKVMTKLGAKSLPALVRMADAIKARSFDFDVPPATRGPQKLQSPDDYRRPTRSNRTLPSSYQTGGGSLPYCQCPPTAADVCTRHKSNCAYGPSLDQP